MASTVTMRAHRSRHSAVARVGCVVALSAFLGGRAWIAPASAPRPQIRQATTEELFDPAGLQAASAHAEQAPQAGAGSVLGAAAIASLPVAVHAQGGQYGLVEGKTVSLLHPIGMAVLFFVSIAAGYTGLQWRRTRELGGEVSALNAELKGPLAELEAAKAASTPDASKISSLESTVSGLQGKLDDLKADRKSLTEGNFRDNHWTLGSVLLGAGVFFAIEGPANTYARAAKLFPGDHLFAGAAITVLWALAAAMVPFMQKGNDNARTFHIGSNVLALSLFTYYQLPSGWGIATKVWEKTSFP